MPACLTISSFKKEVKGIMCFGSAQQPCFDQLINPLGNVLTVISDKRILVCNADTVTYSYASIISATDYSPFGAPLAGRTFSSESYRFAFNGQEQDNEIAGTGNIMTAEFWEYDTRLGRRWNRDPIVIVGLSPFSVFKNNPIYHIDENGLSPESGKEGPIGEGGNNGPGMIDDGNGSMDIPENDFEGLDIDPNDGNVPNANDFEISATGKWSYHTQVGMNVLINVNRKKGANTTIEGLQIIQIATFPSNKHFNGRIGVYTFTKNDFQWYGFVDGGKYSWQEVNKNLPYYYHNQYDLFGNPPDKSIIPLEVDINRRAMYWNNALQSGSIRGYDYPRSSKEISVVNFETIVIGVNANCQGKDIILGSYVWGSEDYGYIKTGIFGQESFPITLPAATRSIKILAHDYPDYQFK